MPLFDAAKARFEGLNTQVLGISVDSMWSHKAWAPVLGGISYPLLSDYSPHGQVTALYGVTRDDGSAERAVFVIDEAGVIRWIDVLPVLELPDIEEILGVVGGM